MPSARTSHACADRIVIVAIEEADDLGVGQRYAAVACSVAAAVGVKSNRSEAPGVALQERRRVVRRAVVDDQLEIAAGLGRARCRPRAARLNVGITT